MIAAPAPLTVDFHSLGLGKRQALIEDVRQGLAKNPKELPPRWFYDERGSQLFELITELPEYYQTRTEAAILGACAADVAARVRPETIVELGAGASTKTRLLIDAACQQGDLRWFVPFDVSSTIVEQSAIELLQQFPEIAIRAVIGDFGEHLDRIPRLGRQLIIFLGSTIGNFLPPARQRFLASVRELMAHGDALLLGVDLVKDAGELIAAYNDAQGVTAEFNLNVLAVINNELDGNFDLTAFQHAASYEPENAWIEMRLRSLRQQIVRIPGADLVVNFDEGELLRTEISAKFTRQRVEQAFAGAGLRLAAWYTDDRQRFAEALAVAQEK